MTGVIGKDTWTRWLVWRAALSGALALWLLAGLGLLFNSAYALTGAAVYVSSDSGVSWKQTSPISRQPGYLTVDPASALAVYTGASYPIAVATTTDGGARWSTIMP